MSQYKRAIVILADGSRPDVLNEEMAKGHLPHLSRLSENGTNTKMLTCFPSTTGPAYLPYLTGCFPGTCNVPGIRWFDKPTYAKKGWGLKSFRSYCGLESMLLDGDMNPEVKTVWDIIENSKSVNNGVTKGIKKGNNLTTGSRIFEFYYAHLTDRWKFLDDATYARLEKTIRAKDFEYAFVVYSSVDEFSHRSSPFHKRVRQCYRDIDELVGKMVRELKEQGIYEETLIALVSDHGLSETHTHFDVGPWLESEKDFKTFYYTNIFKFNFNAASMISGNGMAHLYFENDEGWKNRTCFEELSSKSLLLDELRMRPEVDLVVSQGADGAIHLQTELGHGHFKYSEEQGKVYYEFNRQDPLEIFSHGDSRLNDGFSLDDSMKYSFESHFPDVFQQMVQLFKSPRTGDVILSAKSGFDLREKFEHPLHKASHGAICPEHMFVPLIMNAPINRDHVRSVDVFPTVLELLGRSVPANIDGKSLT